MPITSTSENSPLRIASVAPGDGQGRIGITLCPGKTDPAAMSGATARDLDTDLDAVRGWGASAVVTLITEEEIDHLGVHDIREAVRDRHMEWWHAPIPDGMPPGANFEEAWTVAGDAIRDRLRLGFDVLVNCKGGLGRAGTVAARLLVELGGRPDEAVRRVREIRPGAIENEAQEAHVATCSRRPPGVPPRCADAIDDRALGAFLGLAVGDAVGTTLEFRPRDAQRRLDDMVGGGPFRQPPGGWTDDTAMALALADSLVATGTLDVRDLMDRFVRWWRHGDYSHTGECDDIGNTTLDALDRYQQTGNPLAGSTDPRSAATAPMRRPVAVRWWKTVPAGRGRRAIRRPPARRRWTPAGHSRSCSPMPSRGRRASMSWPRGGSRVPRPSPESWPGAGGGGRGIRSAPAGTSCTPWRPPSGRSPAPETSVTRSCSRPTWPTTRTRWRRWRGSSQALSTAWTASPTPLLYGSPEGFDSSWAGPPFPGIPRARARPGE